MAFALEGIRVLDLSVYQQGPYASAMLADMGADVIKIESPDIGDLGRTSGGDSYFDTMNRNKRGIALDLKNEQGRETFLRLVETADIFHNNLRPGVLDRLKLTYDVLKERNPRIIVSHATGWGHLGPDAEAGLGSFNGLAQARGGLYSVNRTADGEPHGVPVAVPDQVGGMISAFGMLLALVERDRSGVGQEVNSSLYGSQLAMQASSITNAAWAGKNPAPHDEKWSPRGAAYQCSDGLLQLAGGAPDRWWASFCEKMGVPELGEGVYSKNARDKAWCDHAYNTLAAVFGTKTRDEWMAILSPQFHVQPVRTYLEIAEDPQAWANGYMTKIPWRDGTERPFVGLPVHMSRTPGSIRTYAPEMGEHTDEILAESGFSAQEIASLRESGAFGQPAPEGAPAAVAAE